MPRVNNKDMETFNDGALDICAVSERTIMGTKYSGIRFGKKTVGISRFWNAQMLSNNIDKLVSILPLPDIDRMDICVIDGEQYSIKQIQEKFDKKPACLYLSLERIPIQYKDGR